MITARRPQLKAERLGSGSPRTLTELTATPPEMCAELHMPREDTIAAAKITRRNS